jgi:competence protein ComGC
MQTQAKTYGFTLIEFFLSIFALFLLLIITFPILQEYNERSQKKRIVANLNQILSSANQYFEEYDVYSVSLYEFIGPRKVISELEIIEDEVYPEIIYRDEGISAHSEKYGSIIAR